MFERYTEKARRSVFFARYEAQNAGSPYIEAEHLMLGILREDDGLLQQLGGTISYQSLRDEVEHSKAPFPPPASSVDLPLSNPCKRVLAYAAEEAERAGHRHIGTEHLFAGLLRESDSVAARLLKKRGIELEQVRTIIGATAPPFAAPAGGKTYERFGGMGTGNALHRPSAILFVCADEVVSSALHFAGSPLPRTGEQVVLQSEQAGRRTFRVDDVVYHYNAFSQNLPFQHTLVKIEVQVSKLEPQSDEPF